MRTPSGKLRRSRRPCPPPRRRRRWPASSRSLQRTAGNRAVVRMLARDAAPVEKLDAERRRRRCRPTASCSSSSSRARTPRSSAHVKREAIVKLALSQVGKVRDENRGDGKKKGAERIEGVLSSGLSELHAGLRLGHREPGHVRGDDPEGPTRRSASRGRGARSSGSGRSGRSSAAASSRASRSGSGKVHYFAEASPAMRALVIKPGDMIWP